MGATLKEDTTASQLNLIHSLTLTFSVSLFTPLCLCPSVSCLSRSLTITMYIYIYTSLSVSPDEKPGARVLEQQRLCRVCGSEVLSSFCEP